MVPAILAERGGSVSFKDLDSSEHIVLRCINLKWTRQRLVWRKPICTEILFMSLASKYCNCVCVCARARAHMLVRVLHKCVCVVHKCVCVCVVHKCVCVCVCTQMCVHTCTSAMHVTLNMPKMSNIQAKKAKPTPGICYRLQHPVML